MAWCEQALKERQQPLEAVRSDPLFAESCKLILEMLDTDGDGKVTLALALTAAADRCR